MKPEQDKKLKNTSLSHNTIEISLTSEKEKELEHFFDIENSLNKSEKISMTFDENINKEKEMNIKLNQVNNDNPMNIIDAHDCDNISGKIIKNYNFL